MHNPGQKGYSGIFDLRGHSYDRAMMRCPDARKHAFEGKVF